MERLLLEDPDWKPREYGGTGSFPSWFWEEYLRIYRPPISRILKKANKQIRETKEHLGLSKSRGVLVLVNDSFTTLEPNFVLMVVADLLCTSYSSIDCFVYTTVNRYVEVEGSDLAHLLWTATYSERAEDSLVSFVDQIGARWFDFLEPRVGPYSDRVVTPHSDNPLDKRMKAIAVPGDKLILPFSKRSL